MGPRVVLLTILMSLVPAAGWAAFASLYQVAQPIFTDAGVTVVEVPFLTFKLDWRDPAAELLLTATANSVVDDNGPAQLNEATNAGVRFVNTGEWYEIRKWPRLRGDTLEVLVDLTGMPPLPKDERIRENHRRLEGDILSATLWCGLKNARAHWPTVRFIRYHFKGGKLHSRLEGLYSLEHLQAPSHFVEWGDGKLLEAARARQ